MNPNGTRYYTPQVSLRDHAITRIDNALSDIDAAIANMRRDLSVSVDEILELRNAAHTLRAVRDRLEEGE